MNYRQSTSRTYPKVESIKESLSLGALGLGGEAGEVVDLIKKILHHGKELDRDKLILELGDVRWYLEYLAAAIDVTMEEIEQRNIEKLKKRYPEGFSFEASKNRVDQA